MMDERDAHYKLMDLDLRNLRIRGLAGHGEYIDEIELTDGKCIWYLKVKSVRREKI